MTYFRSIPKSSFKHDFESIELYNIGNYTFMWLSISGLLMIGKNIYSRQAGS